MSKWVGQSLCKNYAVKEWAESQKCTRMADLLSTKNCTRKDPVTWPSCPPGQVHASARKLPDGLGWRLMRTLCHGGRSYIHTRTFPSPAVGSSDVTRVVAFSHCCHANKQQISNYWHVWWWVCSDVSEERVVSIRSTNELDLGGGNALFAPSELTIMQTISVYIHIRWPISVDIKIKLDSIYWHNYTVASINWYNHKAANITDITIMQTISAGITIRCPVSVDIIIRLPVIFDMTINVANTIWHKYNIANISWHKY